MQVWLALLTHAVAHELAAALLGEGTMGAAAAARAAAEAQAQSLAEDGTGAARAVDRAQGEAAEARESRGPAGPSGRAAPGPVSSPAVLPSWRSLLAGGGYSAVALKELLADERRYLRHYSDKVGDGAEGWAAARPVVPGAAVHEVGRACRLRVEAGTLQGPKIRAFSA